MSNEPSEKYNLAADAISLYAVSQIQDPECQVGFCMGMQLALAIFRCNPVMFTELSLTLAEADDVTAKEAGITLDQFDRDITDDFAACIVFIGNERLKEM